ncbi:hypothetical protein AVEN_117989-1 [Araneus ventricosus]|uniref:Uncharacterized protein n=1 Tax=Araneus ventricosus TaxID=182803 RepID=A0A4Y2C858_ARAVE|nr:hypothetical protein AVEN_117989-1 [Araneus ventricosus]
MPYSVSEKEIFLFMIVNLIAIGIFALVIIYHKLDLNERGHNCELCQNKEGERSDDSSSLSRQRSGND